MVPLAFQTFQITTGRIKTKGMVIFNNGVAGLDMKRVVSCDRLKGRRKVKTPKQDKTPDSGVGGGWPTEQGA